MEATQTRIAWQRNGCVPRTIMQAVCTDTLAPGLSARTTTLTARKLTRTRLIISETPRPIGVVARTY